MSYYYIVYKGGKPIIFYSHSLIVEATQKAEDLCDADDEGVMYFFFNILTKIHSIIILHNRKVMWMLVRYEAQHLNKIA